MRRVRPDHVPLVVHYDDARLEGLLDGWSNSVAHGLREGGLRFVGTTVVPIEPQAGTGLLRDEARRRLVRALTSPSPDREIQLPLGAVQPNTDRNDVDQVAQKARAVLAAAVEVDAGPNKVVLAPAQIAPMLGTRVVGDSLDLTLDPNKLKFALGSLVGNYEQPPVDATFAVSSAATVSVVPSQDGHVVDYDAAASEILALRRQVVLQRKLVHPEHDTAWAKALGIAKQVSTFTTYYPAGQPRVHNIHLAADTLNNTVVEPGKVFSLNGVLGQRTPEKGYVKAPILVEDGFGEDYGGGISQLATTLYNAIFWGGYVDVEHSPHAFYISRYPMGREATVVYPSVDVKFRDDTSHAVLIRASYSATSITVTFFGDNEGRVVHEMNRKILKTVPITDSFEPCPVKNPKDDPNNACPHLAPGEKYLAQSGETGYDVEFDRVIDQPGHAERQYHYAVHYPMLPNRYLVGAGGVPPSSGGSPSSSASSTAPATTHTTGPPKTSPTTRPG
jgi:vancomycin resistance protein YoaR